MFDNLNSSTSHRGFTSSNQEVIDILRQRSRPYLFSNSLAPSVVCASIQAIDMIETSSELIQKINFNTEYFRKEVKNIGLEIKEGLHPIVPIMINDAKLANSIAQDMLELGIYVVGFSYPVVPKRRGQNSSSNKCKTFKRTT